ncbi:MAG TPA: DUF342 domain-containing protein [Firmicutes bacterium]|nr:DUF342 domain-containing protein [Bacillota bacterium]
MIDQVNARPKAFTPKDALESPGTVEIRDGRVIVRDPQGHGALPVIIPSPGVVVFVNGKVVSGAVPLKSDFSVELFAPPRPPACRLSLQLSSSKLKAKLIVQRVKGAEYSIEDAPPAPRVTVRASTVAELDPAPPTTDQVLALLKKEGVTYGIDYAAIAQALDHDGVTVIAKGDPPVPGEDARIEYYFSPDEYEIRRFSEDEQVDHWARRELVTVEEGTVLARKTPPRAGTPGITVTGDVIPVPPVKDHTLQAGPGVEIVDDGLTAVAARSGRPFLKNNVLSVLPVHVVEGDADLKTGSITFSGHVVIKGNVQPGIKVDAGGDVLIHGSAEQATIIAGGTVKVWGNLISSHVRAGGLDALGSSFVLKLEEFESALELLAKAVHELKSHVAYRTVAFELRDDAPIIRLLLDKKLNMIPQLIAALLELENSVSPEVADQLKYYAARYSQPGPVDLHSVEEIEADVEELKRMIANHRAHINLPANLRLSYALNSTMEASGWVRVFGSGCFNSHIRAGQDVEIGGLEGVFRGGSIISGGNVRVKSLGAPLGAATLVQFLPGKRVTAEVVYPNVTLKAGWQAIKVTSEGRLLEAFVDRDGVLRVEKLGPQRQTAS